MRLHRTLLSFCYQIGDSQLGVIKQDNQWQLLAIDGVVLAPEGSPAYAWLARHGLQQTRFATRREAARTATALLALEPLPQPAAARLVANGRGGYSCGAYSVIPRSSIMRWTVVCPGYKPRAALTLHDAALIISGDAAQESA